LDNENIRLTGKFEFYSNDKLIGTHKNAFTVAGRSIAIKSLLGHIPNFVDSMGVGLGASPNTLNANSTLIVNNSLDFELARVPVEGSTFQLSTATSQDTLVYYATLADSDQYKINEIAIFPSKNVDETISLDGEVIINFDNDYLFSKYGTTADPTTGNKMITTSSARIGGQMMKVVEDASTSTNYMGITTDIDTLSKIDSYSSKDTFRLAVANPSANAASCVFGFYTDDSNYYTLIFGIPAAVGYYVLQKTKDSVSTIGSPDWKNITSITVSCPAIAGAGTHILLDALKIDIGSYVLDTNFGMISRAVLPNPIEKVGSIPLTIQYSIIVDFVGGT